MQSEIEVEVAPGFYMTPTNDYVYYLYVANNGRIDKKYFEEIKAAIEKIVNHEIKI
jgi:hypothetical protein